MAASAHLDNTWTVTASVPQQLDVQNPAADRSVNLHSLHRHHQYTTAACCHIQSGEGARQTKRDSCVGGFGVNVSSQVHRPQNRCGELAGSTVAVRLSPVKIAQRYDGL